jgi:hypothetical protein
MAATLCRLGSCGRAHSSLPTPSRVARDLAETPKPPLTQTLKLDEFSIVSGLLGSPGGCTLVPIHRCATPENVVATLIALGGVADLRSPDECKRAT